MTGEINMAKEIIITWKRRDDGIVEITEERLLFLIGYLWNDETITFKEIGVVE